MSAGERRDLRAEAMWAVSVGPVLVPGSKLNRPQAKPADIRRERLLATMCADNPPVLALVAPAGFGKTTSAAQWAQECNRPIAWTTLDATDNDPVVLISTLVAAIARADPRNPEWHGHLTGDEPIFAREVRPRFLQFIAELQGPVTIVVDDVHVLHDPRCLAVIDLMCDAVPTGSQVALLGRSMTGLHIELFQGRGRLVLLTANELAFDRQETELALASLGELTEANPDWEQVAAETAGWPVAVYLSAKTGAYVRGWLPSDLTSYLDREVLAEADSDVRELLGRTAILDTLCAPLCDAVIAGSDSDQLLAKANRESSLVIRLEGPGDWYRLHPLLRQRLLDMHAQFDDAQVHLREQRASEWYRDHGFTDNAIAHAISSGNVALMGAEIWDEAIRTILFGRVGRLQQWLGRVSLDQTRRSAALSMSTAWAGINTGNTASAHQWVEHAQYLMDSGQGSGETPDTVPPLMALMRAVMGREGFAASAVLAQRAFNELPVAHPVRPLALLQFGVSRTFAGDLAVGRSAIAEARSLAREAQIGNTWAQAAAMSAAFALLAGESRVGADLATEARSAWVSQQLMDSAPSAVLVEAVSAWQAAINGEREVALSRVARAGELAPRLDVILAWLPVFVDALAVGTFLELGSVDRANETLGRCRQALRTTPASPFLSATVEQLAANVITAMALDELSPAERRVWELLVQRLTLQEIADRLFVSRETVKTQTAAIYRKLGVRNRREAQEFADSRQMHAR